MPGETIPLGGKVVSGSSDLDMFAINGSDILENVKEGVEVKMIIDKFGSWKVPIDEFKHLKSNGIQLCFFNVPIYPYVRHTDNRRLHRKFFIIDGKVVHFGGLNISDEYCSFSTKYGYWADSNFCAKGLIVNEYESVFLHDWALITKQKLDNGSYLAKWDNNMKFNSSVLTFEDGPQLRTTFLEDSLDFWINKAQKSIKIATPYFIPTRKIMTSLQNALRRGVNIEIFIPGKPDKAFTYKATLYYANEITKNGGKIFIFNETFLHSKFGVFDDEFAYIGTNNLDMRSFYTNQESVNLVFGKEIVELLNKNFDFYKDFSNLQQLSNSKFKNLVKKFLFKLTAPLM